MKVGIKKIHENEWLVHVGFANMHLDRFSVELLAITLSHVQALSHGQAHSILQSYIELAQRIKQLDDKGMQQLTRAVDSQDLLGLLTLSQDSALQDKILRNVGSMVAKQLRADLQKHTALPEDQGKAAVKTVVETLFDLESQGKVEFFSKSTAYI